MRVGLSADVQSTSTPADLLANRYPVHIQPDPALEDDSIQIPATARIAVLRRPGTCAATAAGATCRIPAASGNMRISGGK